MAARLSDYLAEWGPAPHRWGECDCYLFAVRWAREIGTVPAMEVYRDRREGLAALRSVGGLLPAFDLTLSPRHWRRTGRDRAEIAVLTNGRALGGAIGDGRYFVGKRHLGLARVRRDAAAFVAGWEPV